MQESTIEHGRQVVTGVALLALLLFGGHAAAATAADTEVVLGNSEVSVEAIEPLSLEQLDTLVAPIALYPDALVGIVLPASTYPLQVVQAARFLEARAADDSLKPDPEWDDSVVALLNYPEVLELMDDDLDWTWRLGEAVLLQQPEVIDAVAEFRKRARLAGNLESDEHQTVEVNDDGIIEIDPADPEELYIPYYEPEEVTVYQRSRVYHYYPRAYPVYYYPYPSDYYFPYSFWGVTSFYSVGWQTHHLHLHHYGFYDHPYFNHYYYDPFYYRRPHLWLSLNYYDDHYRYRHHGSHHQGNYWYGNRHHRGAGPNHRRHEQHRAREDHNRADRRRQRRLASRYESFEGNTEQTIRHRRSGRTGSRQNSPALTSDAQNTVTAAGTATPAAAQTRGSRQRAGNATTRPRGNRRSERTADVQPRERATRSASVRAQRNDIRRSTAATSPRRVAENTATRPVSQPRPVRAQSRRSTATAPRAERKPQIARVKTAPQAQRSRTQPARARPSRTQTERAQPRRPATVTQQRPRQVAAQSTSRPAKRESRAQPSRQSSSHTRSQSRSQSRNQSRSRSRSVNRGAHRSTSSAGLRRHN